MSLFYCQLITLAPCSVMTLSYVRACTYMYVTSRCVYVYVHVLYYVLCSGGDDPGTAARRHQPSTDGVRGA